MRHEHLVELPPLDHVVFMQLPSELRCPVWELFCLLYRQGTVPVFEPAPSQLLYFPPGGQATERERLSTLSGIRRGNERHAQ